MEFNGKRGESMICEFCGDVTDYSKVKELSEVDDGN